MVALPKSETSADRYPEIWPIPVILNGGIRLLHRAGL
jgi:hypothetical protein